MVPPMPMRYRQWYAWLLALLLSSGSAGMQGLAQTADSTFIPPATIGDTTQPELREPLKRVKEKSRQSFAEFRTDRLIMRQDELIEQIRKQLTNAKTYLRRRFDTAAVHQELDRIQDWYNMAGKGVFHGTALVQTHRNLATTTKILEELRNKAMARKDEVDLYQHTLMRYRNGIDSLISDSALYILPGDAVQLQQYIQKLQAVRREFRPGDSLLENAIPRVRALQLRVNEWVSTLTTSLETIDGIRHSVAVNSFVRELPLFWQGMEQLPPWNTVTAFSRDKQTLSWKFYVENNKGYLVCLLLLIIAITLFLTSLKKHLARAHLLDKEYKGQQVLHYPCLSAIIIVISLFQFVLPNPPFVLSYLLWLVVALCLTVVFRRVVARYWLRAWLLLLPAFLATGGVNLLLLPSTTERWIMAVLSAGGGALGIACMSGGRRHLLQEKYTWYFLGLMVALQLLATIANLYGLYNFAKTNLVTGFCSLMVAIQLLWAVRFINESLFLASEVYRGVDRKLFYVNYQKIGTRPPAFFYILLLIGWFILFGRNFYLFHLLTDPVLTFLLKERTVGTYTFTIGSIGAFFLILAVSILVSRIVSFFASGTQGGAVQAADGKVGIGSWLLLVRIAIISIGLLLAFAAAGIPLDKITLILGALGVGIGFGLQTLVNNLVSGLIIAFEKPVNVGDIVEVAGKAGTIQSIGFRSSILAAWDGAVVVIPNGDLLNQHVVNWTQGNTLRRGDVSVGVAYGSNLEQVKTLLMDSAMQQEKILKFPPPAVLITAFGASAIDFQVFFWLAHARELGAVKSDLIFAIQNAFNTHAIEIPYPVQDLRVEIKEKK